MVTLMHMLHEASHAPKKHNNVLGHAVVLEGDIRTWCLGTPHSPGKGRRDGELEGDGLVAVFFVCALLLLQRFLGE